MKDCHYATQTYLQLLNRRNCWPKLKEERSNPKEENLLKLKLNLNCVGLIRSFFVIHSCVTSASLSPWALNDSARLFASRFPEWFPPTSGDSSSSAAFRRSKSSSRNWRWDWVSGASSSKGRSEKFDRTTRGRFLGFFFHVSFIFFVSQHTTTLCFLCGSPNAPTNSFKGEKIRVNTKSRKVLGLGLVIGPILQDKDSNLSRVQNWYEKIQF